MNTEKLSHPPIAPLCSSTTSGETKKQIYVQKEIKVALDVADEKPEGTIFVIPLRLSDCKVPERLQHLQWVNYFEPGGYRNLRKALSIRARQLCYGSAIDSSSVNALVSSVDKRRTTLEHYGSRGVENRIVWLGVMPAGDAFIVCDEDGLLTSWSVADGLLIARRTLARGVNLEQAPSGRPRRVGPTQDQTSAAIASGELRD